MPKLNSDTPFRIRLQGLAPKVEQRAEAETEGNISKLIRRALERYLDDRPAGDPGPLTELANQVANLVVEMRHIGGNLNQCARYYNIHRELQREELAAVHRELLRQFQALMTVLKRTNEQLAERKN